MKNETYASRKNPESKYYLVATFFFGDWDRKGDREIRVEFDTFEDMLARYSIERRRRSRADRCTSASYTLELTASGLRAWNEDPEFQARAKDSIGRRITI